MGKMWENLYILLVMGSLALRELVQCFLQLGLCLFLVVGFAAANKLMHIVQSSFAARDLKERNKRRTIYKNKFDLIYLPPTYNNQLLLYSIVQLIKSFFLSFLCMGTKISITLV